MSGGVGETFLAQPNSKNDEGCVTSSGGATPEIRRNYSVGRIIFNAIHACLELTKEPCTRLAE